MSLRVTFIDQVGGAAGGAEQTLATFLEHVPAGITPSAILFEDGRFADRLRGIGVEVDVVPVPDAITTSKRERLQLRAVSQVPLVAIAVSRALKRQRAELAYTNSMKAHVVGSMATRLAGVPCVMHFHDIVEGRALTALRSAARFGSRRRIACSQTVADAIGVGETTVIYGPIEYGSYAALPNRADARAALGLPADGPIVAIVGRINRWKGHDRFVRIAARVAAETDARFAIVGAPVFRDADYVPEIVSLAERIGVSDRITFVPWLDDVRQIYAAADVNCNCSTREPFGRAVVEAAACGVPTVCFDDSGAAETIVDGVTGRKIHAGDEAAFAAAVIDLIRNGDTYARVSSAAREEAVRFDAPRIADEMAAVIRRAAA
jgi:glycosyltransferase involved in cell wall biosynthesis